MLCIFYINWFIDVYLFHCNEILDIDKSIIHLVLQDFIYTMNVVFNSMVKTKRLGGSAKWVQRFFCS